MALLYHWRDLNYRDDTVRSPSSLDLIQNAPLLAKVHAKGERLWAFTRNSRHEYVLAASYVVSSVRALSTTQRYGRFQIRSVPDSVIWFDTEESPSVEQVLRKLSVRPRARPLGQSFQGRAAVRWINPSDDQALAAFSKNLPVRRPPAPEQSQAKSAIPSRESALTIEWNSLEWVDLIPFRFFSSDAFAILESHATVNKETVRSILAKCVVTAKGRRVRIDYGERRVKKYNKAQGLELGTLFLEFTSKERWQLTPDGVGWKYLGGRRLEWGGARIDWPSSDGAADYHFPKGAKAKRRWTQVKDRPGQPAFRTLLEETYVTCCLTGNRVSEALEAAHIDDFEGREFDHPQNGLLLRRDLHALFDCGILGIHPTTLVAHFATAESRAMYPRIDGQAVLRPPYARFANRAPSRAALKRHWKQFMLRRESAGA